MECRLRTIYRRCATAGRLCFTPKFRLVARVNFRQGLALVNYYTSMRYNL